MRRLPRPGGGEGEAERPYDFAIVGAGAAGISLAVQLEGAFWDARLCLIDPGLGDLTNRTFAFWCEGDPPMRRAVSRSWSTFRVVTPSRSVDASTRRYRYHVIEGTSFADIGLGRLAEGRRTVRVADAATTIEPLEGGALIHTRRSGSIHARWVFDSRLETTGVPADPARHVALTQHFLGWELEVERDVFDPEVVTLFDFRVPQGAADVRFVYVLPFSARRALVEHVCHHAHDAADDLARYVEDTLGIGRYTIVRREAGDSPLTDAPFPRRAGPRTLRIGIAGGRLKPSSGYAFTRIWEDSRRIVRSLREEGHPFDLPPDLERFRLLDGLMLRVMRRHPGRMGAIFLRMFERNPADRVFAFLDEAVGVEDVLALGTSLPPGPFADALGDSLRLRLKQALRRLVEPPGYDG